MLAQHRVLPLSGCFDILRRPQSSRARHLTTEPSKFVADLVYSCGGKEGIGGRRSKYRIRVTKCRVDRASNPPLSLNNTKVRFQVESPQQLEKGHPSLMKGTDTYKASCLVLHVQAVTAGSSGTRR